MYDFSKVQVHFKIEDILSHVSEEQIFFFYFGPFDLKSKYCSKIRRDSDPSCSFYTNKNHHLTLKDFGTNETWNCFTYVQKLFGCNFPQALSIIAKDFGLMASCQTVSPIVVQSDVFKQRRHPALIQFNSKPFCTIGLNWWGEYGIGEELLIKEHVYNVDDCYIDKKKMYTESIKFAYPLINASTNKSVGVKIYSPFDDRKMKWRSSIKEHQPFGMNNLNYDCDHVVVCKSRKDELVCKTIGLNTISVQSESESSVTNELIDHLKSHFPIRWLIFDSDEVGRRAASHYSDHFDLAFTPIEDYVKWGLKDPSDYRKFYGEIPFIKLFEELNIKV